MPVMIELDGCIIEHGDCLRAEREIINSTEDIPKWKIFLMSLFKKRNIK